MHIPENFTFDDLVELAREEGGAHVADVVQNILALDLSDAEQCEVYDLAEPIDGDCEVSESLLSAIIEIVDTRIDGVDEDPDEDTGNVPADDDDEEEDGGFDDDDDEDDGGDEDDPYDVSVDTLRNVLDFLTEVRAAL